MAGFGAIHVRHLNGRVHHHAFVTALGVTAERLRTSEWSDERDERDQGRESTKDMHRTEIRWFNLRAPSGIKDRGVKVLLIAFHRRWCNAWAWQVVSTMHTASRTRVASRRLTDWILSWGDRRSAPLVLVVLTLLEATVFPAPTEALLLTLCISRPKRSWAFGLLAAVGSVAGGIVGYHLGASLYDEIARPLIAALGLAHYVPFVSTAYRENLWLALGSSGYTPVPYMLYTMMAGAFGFPLDSFAAASFIGRALKYIPIAVLAVLFGPGVRRILKRYAGWAGLGITLLVVGAVVWRML